MVAVLSTCHLKSVWDRELGREKCHLVPAKFMVLGVIGDLTVEDDDGGKVYASLAEVNLKGKGNILTVSAPNYNLDQMFHDYA